MPTLPGLREAAVDAPRRGEGILGVLEETADRIAGAAKAAAPPRVAAVYAMLASAGALPVALRAGLRRLAQYSTPTSPRT
ncbi:MAG TPA: hypothetical protein EYP33_07725 [Pyrodictium sp.]|nr:hypothetical protein [Pyrodictium sp.]